jgi:hypothetical protein
VQNIVFSALAAGVLAVLAAFVCEIVTGTIENKGFNALSVAVAIACFVISFPRFVSIG